jgi:hypothetical protein
MAKEHSERRKPPTVAEVLPKQLKKAVNQAAANPLAPPRVRESMRQLSKRLK